MTRSLLPYTLIALAFSAGAEARTLGVGPNQEFRTPSAAVAAAREGDHVLIQPGEYFDCAVVDKNRVVIEGAGKADQVVLTDKMCEGKALLVIRGDSVTVRNLTLTRARVPDENGAGIRGEARDLTVDGVRFVNNQEGILDGAGSGTMLVKDSYFEHNGFCGRACAHAIYVGNLDTLRVERTHFIDTRRGHHVKSRAKRTEIIDSDIEDGPTGTASYLIEVPLGGSLVVRGSTLVKGPHAENHTAAIMIGSEGVSQPTREILVENNTFTNQGSWQTIFVDNQTATEAQLRGNRISGSVVPLKGDGQVVAAR